MTRLLPDLYFHGLSQGDFELALRGLLGDGVYAWADGIYVKAGLEKDKAALLVVIGALSDGRRRSWRSGPAIASPPSRGAPCCGIFGTAGCRRPAWCWPMACRSGALSTRSGPKAAQQRCWNHKILNVLNDLPKRVQGPARALLTQIPTAKTRQQAQRRCDRFAARYDGAYPAAVATLERDWERMVTFSISRKRTGDICARRTRWRAPLPRSVCEPTRANATSESKEPPPSSGAC